MYTCLRHAHYRYRPQLPYKSHRTYSTNRMGSISHHITPLVIDSLGGGHTHTNKHTQTNTHYLQLEVTCTHSKKNYKSTGVYGETIFRIHLNVWSNYYHFNNSVIQVYNKYVHRISYNFPWQISLSVITYLPWLQPLSQLVS